MNLYSPRLIITPITSSVGKIYPFEILLAGGQGAVGGLDKDSKIMLDQMRSVDKRRLIRKIGIVDQELLMKACAIAQKLIQKGVGHAQLAVGQPVPTVFDRLG